MLIGKRLQDFVDVFVCDERADNISFLTWSIWDRGESKETTRNVCVQVWINTRTSPLVCIISWSSFQRIINSVVLNAFWRLDLRVDRVCVPILGLYQVILDDIRFIRVDPDTSNASFLLECDNFIKSWGTILQLGVEVLVNTDQATRAGTDNCNGFWTLNCHFCLFIVGRYGAGHIARRIQYPLKGLYTNQSHC